MSLTLIYEGVDITSKVNIRQCVHDMYGEKHADTLLLKFSNSAGLWDKWNPKPGDNVEITDGNIRSGTMFVKKIEPMSGYFTIRASSIPVSASVQYSQAWEEITKLQLANDISKKHGLKLKTFGITDRKFPYLKQSSMNDLEFFENICVLEGDAFLIYDKCMIFYNEKYLETQNISNTIVISGANKFHYEEQMSYSGCTIRNESKEFTYRSTEEYEYLAEKTIQMHISSDGDAERYAKNMLRYLNKEKKKGYFYVKPHLSDYAAGSVVRLKTSDTESYDGIAFITHIRHDFSNGMSKIFFRTIQEE